MTRIMIIGSGGSGKSTFAAALGDKWQMPVYHLDAYYWKPGWTPTPNDEWDHFLDQIVSEDEWIIDGHYGRTLETRMNRSDIIIFFDLSPWITTYRVIKRRIKYHGKTRPDLNEGCPERLDWEFVKWTWNFRRDKRPGILQLLSKHGENKRIIIFKNKAEVTEFFTGQESPQ
ncbi:DNA topology modulation protein [Paenibacillus sp. JCM 10914]|uniref:DNA topology modulation protein n=1 Tax=Paenibacillus sp. JCM 10914 TaxID=1236974 RepID=UPI0003CC4B07|nr:DNA topology modulation protein [Paenibacillus sp. JCM 10914]GAE06807.1 topology modulation protein [Paenibacillus sp. JCM 10914]